MKARLWFITVFLSVLSVSCKKDIDVVAPDKDSYALTELQKEGPHPKIAIVSDIHFMYPSLLANGAANGVAFQSYLNQDPKLLEYSLFVFQNVIMDLKRERPDILLVPGDLTKDGELINHESVAGYLAQLRAGGTKVFVVPGNHDINNAKAVQYNGNNSTPLPRTSVNDFANIYKHFGYENTERDATSLSYLAKPYKDLWILAIDASKYEEFGPSGDIADGRIKSSTMTWLLSKLAEAKNQKVTVFAMMHQNLVEHYANQTQLDPGYVIDDWQNKVNALMDAGLNVIFTGHYHANDITAYSHNGNELFDIQTGSLVTAPMPYRLVTVKNKKLEISTKTVQTVATSMPGGLSFPAYSNLFLSQHLDGYFNYYLQNILGAPAPVADFASPLYRNAIMAHFAGDERMPADQRTQIHTLASMSQQLAGIATILWTDLNTADNNVTIKFGK